MKEIFDNWKQFINEQNEKLTVQFSRASKVANEKYHGTEFSSEQWEDIKTKAQNYPIEKAAKLAAAIVLRSGFSSYRGKQSFVRLAQAKKGKIKGLRSDATEQEIIDFYTNTVLPKIKKIVNNIDVVNLSTFSPSAKDKKIDGLKYAISKARKGSPIAAFFAFSGELNSSYIGLNPYASIAPDGKIYTENIKVSAAEEFVHAVDAFLGSELGVDLGEDNWFFSSLLKDDFKKVVKQNEKDTDFDDPKTKKYYLKPKEQLPKFRAIKRDMEYFEGQGYKFFNPDGTVRVESLKSFLEDPDMLDRHPIIKTLDTDKVEEIGKILDQLARADQEKSSQMA